MNIYDLKGKEYINAVEITAQAIYNKEKELDEYIYKLNEEIINLQENRKNNLEAQKEVEILESISKYNEAIFDNMLRNAKRQMHELNLTYAALTVLNGQNKHLKLSRLYVNPKVSKSINKEFIKKLRAELISLLPKKEITRAEFLIYFKQAVINLTIVEEDIAYPSPKKTASYLIKSKKLIPTNNGYKLK